MVKISLVDREIVGIQGTILKEIELKVAEHTACGQARQCQQLQAYTRTQFYVDFYFFFYEGCLCWLSEREKLYTVRHALERNRSVLSVLLQTGTGVKLNKRA